MNVKFYASVAKGLKLKVWKFWGLISTIVEVTGEKLVGRPFWSPPPILNRVKDIEKEIDSLPPQYEMIIILWNFNCEVKEETMSTFGEVHNLKNLIKQPTCFKNSEKPTIIDLISTNKLKCFQYSCTYEIGISVFDKMIITVMKVVF